MKIIAKVGLSMFCLLFIKNLHVLVYVVSAFFNGMIPVLLRPFRSCFHGQSRSCYVSCTVISPAHTARCYQLVTLGLINHIKQVIVASLTSKIVKDSKIHKDIKRNKNICTY